MSASLPFMMLSSTSHTATVSTLGMRAYSSMCANPCPRRPQTPTRTRSLAPKTLSGAVIKLIPESAAALAPFSNSFRSFFSSSGMVTTLREYPPHPGAAENYNL